MKISIKGSFEDQLKFIFKCFGYEFVRQNEELYDIYRKGTTGRMGYIEHEYEEFNLYITQFQFIKHRASLMEICSLYEICSYGTLSITVED